MASGVEHQTLVCKNSMYLDEGGSNLQEHDSAAARDNRVYSSPPPRVSISLNCLFYFLAISVNRGPCHSYGGACVQSLGAGAVTGCVSEPNIHDCQRFSASSYMTNRGPSAYEGSTYRPEVRRVIKNGIESLFIYIYIYIISSPVWSINSR